MDEINDSIQGDGEFDTLLSNVVKDKGGTKAMYKQLLDQIAYHESAGTMSPTIKQYSGGPGRGKYQFEGKGGSNRILTSAVRTKNYYRKLGREVPTFIQSIINKGTEDATTLSSEQQDILALGDLRMKSGINLKDYADGKLSVQDIWADHWWAGSKKLRQSKIDSFNRSMNSYGLKNNLEQSKVTNAQPIDDKAMMTRDVTKVRDATNVNVPNVKPIYNSTINTDSMQYKPKATTPPPQSLSSYLDNYISNIPSESNDLNEFNGGGTHEQNPNGGIPQGMGQNGKPNTVEEDETSAELTNGKFIFSNRIIL